MAKLLIFVLAIGIVTGGIAFFRLPPGWITPSFQAALTGIAGTAEIDIPEAQARWGGWRHPLGMVVRNVTIQKKEKGLALKVPSLLLSVEILPLFLGKANVGRCSFEDASLYVNDRLIGKFSGKVKKRLHTLSAHIHFQNLDATTLSHLAVDRTTPNTLSFPLFGNLMIEGTLTAGITKIKAFCQSKNGNLLLPVLYPKPVSLNEVKFRVTGNDHALTFTGNVKREGSNLTIEGKLLSPLSWKTLYETGGKMDLHLKGGGTAIPIDDLNLLWPHGLSPKPRQWVVQHLSKGEAPSATLEMQGVMEMGAAGTGIRFRVPRLQGEIEVHGITVRYFGKLPPVVDTKGKCSFTREQFIINATGMVNGVHLEKAHLVIHDTHLKDQAIDIDLSLKGPLRNSLEVINAPPLFLPRKLGLEPARVSGQATTHVHLDFPLETNLPLDLVDVKAKSRIQQGEIHYDMKVNNRPVKVDQGSFSLEVSKENLKMEGQANIQTIPAQIQWQEHFKDKGIPFRRQFQVQGNLDLGKLPYFLPMDGYGKGEAKTDIRYTVDPEGIATFESHSDLTPTILVSPVLFWQKEKGKTAHLKIKMHQNPHHSAFILDEATLTAPDLDLLMRGMRTRDANTFDITRLKMGKSELNATLHQDITGTLQANIRGSTLDLSPLLDDSTPPPLLPSPPSTKDGARIKVGLQVDTVTLGNDNALHQVGGDMLYQGDTLISAHLKAQTPHSNQPVSLTVSPLSKDRQQFTLQSNDGGRLLETLGAGYDIEGGHLTIQGIKSKKEQAGVKTKEPVWEMAGNLSIEDFTINKAPLLARLLSAASLQGVVNFFSGKGIHFYTGEAHFSVTPEALTLKDVRLVSPSLGLVFNGTIDRLRSQIYFSGDVIPLYIINTALAQIPLIGPLVSGGREEGIFLTHCTLTGSRQDPTLLINPVTSVTPGVVRELFIPRQSTQTQEDNAPTTVEPKGH